METVKFLLKSLFSNAEVANKGKKQKWWLTFVILLASILLAIVPNIISEIRTNGGQCVTNYKTQQVNEGLIAFSSNYLKDDEAKLSLIVKDGNLVVGDESGNKTFEKLDDKKTVKVNDKDVHYIEIKYSNSVVMVVSYVENKNDFDALENAIITANQVEEKNDKGEVTKVTAPVRNTLFFAKDQFRLSVAASNSSVELTKTDKGYIYNGSVSHLKTFTGAYSKLSEENRDLSNLYRATIAENEKKWVSFFNEAYKPFKFTAIITSTILYLALDVMALVVMIFTTFIMSRFKSSLCEKLSFATAFKFVVFLSLTPGLIAFLIHFIMPGLQSMAFFTCLAIRCIFFNTKFTRGAFNPQQGK